MKPDVFYKTCNRCSSGAKHVCQGLGSTGIFWCEQDGVLMEISADNDEVVATWVPKGLTEAFGKIQEDKDNLLIKQAAALDEIEEVLNDEMCWEHASSSFDKLNSIINKFRGR